MGGVPQGSVLGPTLWNILYDPLFREKLPPGCELVGYADDVILITRDPDPVKTKYRVEKSLNIICNWLLKNDLELAHEKTEAIIITNRRVKIEFSLNNHTIVPAKTVKYLGMYIDRNLQFSSHIRLSCVKAEKCIRAVTCLLGNTYGPPSQKRRVLAHACQSIWCPAVGQRTSHREE